MPFKHLIERANVVMEALPYIRDFHGKIIVIKYGGSAMDDPELKESVIEDIVLLKYLGMHPIVIHGGGKEISRNLKKKKIEPNFIQGQRVTDKATLKVVTNVLGEKINTSICRLIRKHGGKPKRLYGKKGRVIRAKKLWLVGPNRKYIDIGFAGQVTGVKHRYLWRFIKKGYIPVLSPIGVGRKGQTFNINADSAAAAIAGYLKAAKLILLTDVNGVLDHGKLVSQLSNYKAKNLIKAGIISGGMIPKVKYSLKALQMGTEKVHIINGKIPHAILLEIFTDHGIGTMVVKKR